MSFTQVHNHIYSIIIAIDPDFDCDSDGPKPIDPENGDNDWRRGEISVDWVDFTRDKSTDRRERQGEGQSESPIVAKTHSKTSAKKKARADRPTPPGSIPPPGKSPIPSPMRPSSKPKRESVGREPVESADALSLQPLLAHIPGPVPFDNSSSTTGVTQVGAGVVHLFRHSPPPSLVARLEGQNGESSAGVVADAEGWASDHAEGEDGSLIAILAVPAWMRPADFLEFIGGWTTCLEGVRMIREATTPNRSIVLLKFRDPLQAADFTVIFTGRAFSTLDTRETCHPIRIHHLVLHKLESRNAGANSSVPVPAFPPSVYASRARELPDLLSGVPVKNRYELPSCPVCLERLDSTVTGLVTLPCAHTFDCDCLRKWGDSRCPVCRVSHLLLSSSTQPGSISRPSSRSEITRLTQCSMCDSSENNWMCVVCGVVGCGRYSKGHARRHWEDTGHVLAMELETQRVWDYEGDNYVHRLIQTRTDGKLVELPSASSLATTAPSRVLPLNRPPDSGTGSAGGNADNTVTLPGSQEGNSTGDGPSSNDIDKMTTIEAITLEYSYLLSSQLEAMRQHYEAEASSQRARVKDLEASAARLRAAEEARTTAETLRTEAEHARERAERKATKAVEISRGLQVSLGAERAMAEGLSVRISKLANDYERVEREKRDKESEVEALNETVRDLMFSLEAGATIKASGGADAGEGGSLVVVPATSGKKKGKK